MSQPPVTRQKYTRRTFLQRGATGGLGLAVATMLGCSGGGERTPTPTSTAIAAVKRGGVLRMAQAGDLSLNTGHPFTLLPQNRILAYATVETLIEYRNSLTP